MSAETEVEEGGTQRIIRLLEQRLAWTDGPPMGAKDREAITALLNDLRFIVRSESAEPMPLPKTAVDPEFGSAWRYEHGEFSFKDSESGDWIGANPGPRTMRITADRVRMWSSLMGGDVVHRAIALIRTGLDEGWERGDLTNAEDLLAFWDRVYPNTGAEGTE